MSDAAAAAAAGKCLSCGRVEEIVGAVEVEDETVLSSSGSRSEERSEPVNVGCGNNRSGNDSYSVNIVGEIGGVG